MPDKKLMDPAQVTAQFESLGGGALRNDGWEFGWALGCEFGFIQKFAGINPLGLLRWASIDAEALITGLERDFHRADHPQELLLRDVLNDDWGNVVWGVRQLTYRIRLDHTGEKVGTDRELARRNICQRLAFLRRKLLGDLAAGEKIFVYRTFDGRLPDRTLERLATAVNRHGPNTLLYVTRASGSDQAFTVARVSPGLMIGYIDRFAVSPEELRPSHNVEGWGALCRAALSCWEGGAAVKL
jgi:hypothetical protein